MSRVSIFDSVRNTPAGTVVGPVLGLGTAALALSYGAPGATRARPDASVARRTLRAALDRGVRLIDTAPAYGEAEALVGEEVRDSEPCLLATKVAVPAGGWGAFSAAQARTHVRDSLESSLRALRRERIDLLQLHNADAELVRAGLVGDALAELRETGLVRFTGATVYGEANALAVVRDPCFDVVQVAFSALDRRAEKAVLPAADAHATAVIARSVLLRGVLSEAARDLDGPFAPLSAAADELRVALGIGWDELAAAAVAFVLTRPWLDCALLGPHDEPELVALLDGSARLRERAASLALPASELADWLLDPSRWPREAGVGR